MTGPILRIRGLVAQAGGQRILHGLGFDVAETGVTAILGRNGVGKTTTARAVLGLVRREGEVVFAGERIDRELTHSIVRRGLAYVPEDREVFAKLTVAQNLQIARRGDAANRPLVDRLFPELTERSGQLAGTLSGGQQQMLALARVLQNENRLLIVDEPTKGLAPLVVDQVAAALGAAAETVPILLIEQNLRAVSRLAQDVVVLAEGRVVHTGPAAQLLGDPRRLEELLGVHRTERVGNR